MYSLVCDGDGHWFVCPSKKTEAAYQAFHAIEAYYWGMKEFETPPQVPEFLIPLNGGPESVEFPSVFVEKKIVGLNIFRLRRVFRAMLALVESNKWNLSGSGETLLSSLLDEARQIVMELDPPN